MTITTHTHTPPLVLNIHLFSTHCMPGIMSAFCGHTLRRLSAVLTVWSGFPRACLWVLYWQGTYHTFWLLHVYFCSPSWFSHGQSHPFIPFKEHSVWHHNSCSVMFTDELKEGLVPVFGENVLVGRNEVLLV